MNAGKFLMKSIREFVGAAVNSVFLGIASPASTDNIRTMGAVC
jgi:hypothetical protein